MSVHRHERNGELESFGCPTCGNSIEELINLKTANDELNQDLVRVMQERNEANQQFTEFKKLVKRFLEIDLEYEEQTTRYKQIWEAVKDVD